MIKHIAFSITAMHRLLGVAVEVVHRLRSPLNVPRQDLARQLSTNGAVAWDEKLYKCHPMKTPVAT